MAETAAREPPLGLGVIGLGGIAMSRMVPAAQSYDGVRIVAAADVSEERLAPARQALPGIEVYRHHCALLDRPDVDLVYVATPNHLHGRQSLDALAAGKHVLCEKPMAATLAEAEAMVAAAAQRRRLLAVGYMIRHNPVILETRRLYREGALGRLRAVRSHYNYYKAGGTAEFRLAAEREGGGPLFDVGVYALDLIRYVAGEELVDVRGVLGHTREGWTCHDLASFVGRLPSGAVATVDNGFDFDDAGFELFGDAATLVGRRCYGQLPIGTLDIIMPNRRPLGAPRRLVDAREAELPHYHMYRRELELFCECILDGREPDNSGRCGLQDVRVIDQLLANG